MATITARAASSAAAAANTVTTVITPPAGMRYRIIGWSAGQLGGTPTAVELQLVLIGSGSGAVTAGVVIIDEMINPSTGAQLVKGQGTVLYEAVGDGTTAIAVRNVTVLAASTVGSYSVTLDLRADPSTISPA